MSEHPTVIVIGGPNGAGKSTAAPALLRDFAGMTAFLNADVIAQGLSAWDPGSAAVAAGRIMLQRMRECARQRQDFGFETTLASRSLAGWLERLKTGYGYRVFLYYVWLRSADEAVARIRSRVARGGHDVPEDTVRRRYERSVRNLVDLYLPLADAWSFHDNSEAAGPHLVAKRGLDGRLGVINHALWEQVREFADG